MPAQPCCFLTHQRILRRVELFPIRGESRQGRFPIGSAEHSARAGGMLGRRAEDVIDQGGARDRTGGSRDAEGVELAADALPDVQYGRLPRAAGQLGSHPGMSVDRIEDPESDGTNRLPGASVTHGVANHRSDDGVGGRRQQIALIGDVMVDRADPGG